MSLLIKNHYYYCFPQNNPANMFYGQSMKLGRVIDLSIPIIFDMGPARNNHVMSTILDLKMARHIA